jgi:hypothetical protein
VSNEDGPSGQKLRKVLLGLLGIERADAWITDCIDLYHASKDNAARVEDTYRKLATSLAHGNHPLPDAHLLSHPEEADIVRLALEGHVPRLLDDVRRCAPERIITLGNAALRVVSHLAGNPADLPRWRQADASYGALHRAVVAGRVVELLPLAHPAAPSNYQTAHRAWLASVNPR